jgi:hypothetical protein
LAITDVIAQIDAEIAKLQQAKMLLSSGMSSPASTAKSGRGRPKGSKNAAKSAEVKSPAKTAVKRTRKLSAEGRKAISEAMKRRHEERRKQAGK